MESFSNMAATFSRNVTWFVASCQGLSNVVGHPCVSRQQTYLEEELDRAPYERHVLGLSLNKYAHNVKVRFEDICKPRNLRAT